jgi:hypothetical protein
LNDFTKNHPSRLKLFSSFLRPGLTAFGGPAMIAYQGNGSGKEFMGIIFLKKFQGIASFLVSNIVFVADGLGPATAPGYPPLLGVSCVMFTMMTRGCRWTGLPHTPSLISNWRSSYDQNGGAQAQRATVARALRNNPAIVIADEPTAHPDTCVAVRHKRTGPDFT